MVWHQAAPDAELDMIQIGIINPYILALMSAIELYARRRYSVASGDSSCLTKVLYFMGCHERNKITFVLVLSVQWS